MDSGLILGNMESELEDGEVCMLSEVMLWIIWLSVCSDGVSGVHSVDTHILPK